MEETYQEVVENLKSLPDLTLVNNIKLDDDYTNEILKILSDRHSGLYVSTVMRISGNSIPNLKEEMLDEKMYVLYNSAKNYDENRGSAFSTHFANEAKWNCLKNKSKKSNIEIPCEDSFIDTTLNAMGKVDRVSISDDGFLHEKLMEEIALIDDERAKKIINLRYFSSDKKNLSWKKVAKQVKLSIQGCINVHDKYIEQIKKNIKKKYKGL